MTGFLVVALLIGAAIASKKATATGASPSTSPFDDASGDFSGFTLADLCRTSHHVDNTPPSDVYPALYETAARLRLTVQAWPGLRVTSVYRSHYLTGLLWQEQGRSTPQPRWDWHEKGHAVDVAADSDTLAAVLQWAIDSGLWTGADTQNEGNHVHLAWT